MRIISLLFLFSFGAYLFVGAAESDTSGFIELENGTIYKLEVEKKEGESPLPGDIVKMILHKYSPDGRIQFSTDMLDAPGGVEMTLHDNAFPGDILDVFLRMKPGEKALVKVPVWVADKDETLKDSREKYTYEITLISFVTQEALKKQQDELLSKLRIEQKELFDKISDSLAPYYKVAYKTDGLYILKTSSKKVKKKNRIYSKEEIEVHYILKLLPGLEELDNSYARKIPFSLKVDDGQVIKGWDIALMQMQKGDKAILLIPSWLGYGFTGSGRDIGANTPLLFEIDILSPQ